MARILELSRYPVKSLRGTSADTIDLDRRGLAFDRHWALVDAERRAVHQRGVPSMARIGTRLSSRELTLEAPHLAPLVVDLTEGALEPCTVTVHGHAAQALLYGRSDVRSWFEAALGTPFDLVRFASRGERATPLQVEGAYNQVAFDDAYPLSFLSRASLDALNSRFEGAPVTWWRFRPNVVLDGCAAHEEDTWKTVRIGDVLFRAVKPISRCKIITLDPEDGTSDDRPLRALMEYRRSGTKVIFGSYFNHTAVGHLAVGMEVEVIERRTEEETP